MKKYIPDFLTGLGLGLFFFAIGLFVGFIPLSLFPWLYHLAIALLLFIGYFIHFRRGHGIPMKISAIIFLLAFTIPFLVIEIIADVALLTGHFGF